MKRNATVILKVIILLVFLTFLPPCHAETEIRIEWINGACPMGLPATEKEAPQKLAPLVAAIGAVIIPKLVAGGVDLAAKKLQAAGEDRPNIMSARTDDFFYHHLRERNNFVRARCLIIVEADNFNSTPTASPPHTWRPNTKRVGSFENARMIFMASVDLAPEGKLFRLIPAYLELKNWRESSFWNSDRRDYSFTVTMTAIGAAAHFASASIELKGLANNKIYTANDSLMYEAKTDFLPLPPISAEGTAYINSVETAWIDKDRAASILDAKMAFDKEAAEKAAGKIPTLPPLYREPYKGALTKYCTSVATANKNLDKTKQEVPTICNWELDAQLVAVEQARKQVERDADWIKWAQETCFTDPSNRARQIGQVTEKGYLCEAPTSLKIAEKQHTRVTTLVAISEIIPGSKAAKFWGDALASGASDVSKAIVGALPPLTKESRDAVDAAKNALNQAVVLAEYKVEMAESALAELPKDAPNSQLTEARMNRQEAWFAANNALRAAGQLPRYPESKT